MGNNFNFHLNVQLIEDLPLRVEQLLRVLVEGVVLPESFNLPKDEFFNLDGWQKLFTHKSSFASFNKNRLLCTCMNTDCKDLFDNFMTWLLVYILRKNEIFCVGWVSEGADFPILLRAGETGVTSVPMAPVMNPDGPVLIDLRNRRCSAISDKEARDIMADTVRGLFNRLSASTSEKDNN